MGFLEFTQKYLCPFRCVEYVYWASKGFIVWRAGTGENTELLHIKTFVKGRGYGRELVAEMVKRLIKSDCPPYHSVFGFTRATNEEAQAFYGALGFHLQPIEGLYRQGNAVLFWREFEALKKDLL